VEQVQKAATALLVEAAKPVAGNPALRTPSSPSRSRSTRRSTTSRRTRSSRRLLGGGAREGHALVTSFEEFLAENRDEITALQVLYSRPYRMRLKPET
jgi:Domain of unknown function (DUF3559).